MIKFNFHFLRTSHFKLSVRNKILKAAYLIKFIIRGSCTQSLIIDQSLFKYSVLCNIFVWFYLRISFNHRRYNLGIIYFGFVNVTAVKTKKGQL